MGGRGEEQRPCEPPADRHEPKASTGERACHAGMPNAQRVNLELDLVAALGQRVRMIAHDWLVAIVVAVAVARLVCEGKAARARRWALHKWNGHAWQGATI